MTRDREEALIFAALRDVETPEYDILGAVTTARRKRPARRRFPLPRGVLAAALAAALLVGGALAVGLTVGWESFLGKTPEKAVTAVGESAVTGDYTLTLQEAIVDDDGAALLLALTRNDGGVIGGDPKLYHWSVKADGQFLNMGTSEQPPIRSEDEKTVWYCVEFRAEAMDAESLLGQTITFLCGGVVDKDWSEEELALKQETVSLAPLAQTVRQVDVSFDDICQMNREEELLALVEEVSAQTVVPLTRLGPDKAHIAAVLFTSDGVPVVAVSDVDAPVRQGQLLMSSCAAAALTDTRTGESWSCSGYARWGKEDSYYLSHFQDCPLTAEDLPYVEVTVSYQAHKFLSDEPVELSFSADVGQQVEVALDRDVDFCWYSDYSVHVTTAEVSALRLRLHLDRADKWSQKANDDAENTRWTLLEKDGSQILLRMGGLHPSDETQEIGWIDLEARTENGDRALIDPDQAEALLVGETVIPLK